MASHVARADGDICIIVGQVGESSFDVTEKADLVGGRVHVNLHHIYRVCYKHILLLLAAEPQNARFAVYTLPERAQLFIGTGNVKTDRESLLETHPAIIFPNEP